MYVGIYLLGIGTDVLSGKLVEKKLFRMTFGCGDAARFCFPRWLGGESQLYIKCHELWGCILSFILLSSSWIWSFGAEEVVTTCAACLFVRHTFGFQSGLHDGAEFTSSVLFYQGSLKVSDRNTTALWKSIFGIYLQNLLSYNYSLCLVESLLHHSIWAVKD